MIWRVHGAAITAVVMLAACGGTGSGGAHVASLGGRPAATSPSAPVDPARLYTQFAACLRSHGASEPDPTIDAKGNPHWQVPLDSIPLTQKQPCAPLLQQARQGPVNGPPSQAQLATEVKFAQCMRAHGLPSFPDPDPATGDFPGIDGSTPGVQQALPACKSILPPGAVG